MMTSPLNGLKVLELGSSLAGPYACRILGDMGAEIYKVEPPEGGDPARHWGKGRLGGFGVIYQAANRGKKSVAIDFTNTEQLDALKKFVISDIDIVVQNLRPGVVERFGLDAASLMARDNSLIYCNLSAFGSTGPLSKEPGYDPLIQAYGGLVDANGSPGGGPVRIPVQIMDIGTGMWAAMGVLAALNKVRDTGEGCEVDSSMFDAALAWQTIAVAMKEAGDRPPWRDGLTGPLLAPNDGYETKDGILLITAGTARQYDGFCQAINAPELASDERFKDNEARFKNSDEFRKIVEEKLSVATRAEWSSKFSEVNVPVAPILSLQEVIDHPQTAATGMLQSSPDNSFHIMGIPLRFDGTRPAFDVAAPALGNANQAVFEFMEN
jgi:crotonobetainyl-CoA:carnitine CoA-transferase CaiB-like acyl-CoA transferase